ncbi:outer membrane protein [Sphingomonas sp. M1-B02]|uniref:outer membrane protein n=1 Tax=Sphingomonas sp. M1-B02 TaxID=3114300 RepID=UPI00223EC93D|nr:porin family protein [Sphingomonas sp. S6-11]UZK66298.1 porin family protein [Sphingomonas sp. S6-11]
MIQTYSLRIMEDIMNRIIAIAIATSASVLAIGQASAQDQPFSGARVGVEGGWSRLGGGDHRGSDGFTYGASLGYDVASGPVRFGPEVKVSDSTQKHCRLHPVGGPTARICQRSDRDLYVGLRLGYVASPQLLVFGLGGYTNARFSDRYRDLTVGPVRNLDVARDIGGFRLGGGAEYAVTSQIYLTGAYQYSGWKHKAWRRHVHQNQVLAGVGYRF